MSNTLPTIKWPGPVPRSWPCPRPENLCDAGLLNHQGPPMPTIRTVCAHDCPDMCSILAHVENGRVVRIEGDPDHPFTAGFACGKVNRDTGLVHSPERL